MSRNHNRVSRIGLWSAAATASAVLLGFGGVELFSGSSDGGVGVSASASPSAEAKVPVGAGGTALPAGSCRGLIDKVSMVGASKDGSLYEVDAVSGDTCVTIYDPKTLKDEVVLADGEQFTACKFVTDKPARLNIVVDLGLNNYEVEGDVNLSAAGVQSADAIPSCDMMHIPDEGIVRMPGYGSIPAATPTN